jgi:hypothetical protein
MGMKAGKERLEEKDRRLRLRDVAAFAIGAWAGIELLGG